jgi:hypothetical protein
MGKIEKQAWGGWPNCYRISNDKVDLIVTSDIGPRVMRYGFLNGQNLFKTFEESMGRSGESEWMLRGGHRIWAAPEEVRRTYAPDNGPVEIMIAGDSLTAIQPVEPLTGLQKQITVKLAPSGSAVEVRHGLKNTLLWDIEVAPWALSMMAQRGVGITGLPPRGKHPEVLAPTNPLVIWAFTDLSDPRWKFTKKYIILRQDPENAVPQKIGHFNLKTWSAYLLGTDLFIKRYLADPSRPYTDFGCSFEIFTNQHMLELETLGPLTKLAPGASLEHVERWTLHRDIQLKDFTDEELDRLLTPLIS